MTSVENTSLYLPPGEGQSFWVGVEFVNFKLSSDQTGGAYAVTEVITLPEGGANPHQHLENDETYFFLEGEYEFQDLSNGRAFRVTPGAFLQIKRGTVHAYRNTGTTNARYLLVQSPGDLQGFFEDLGSPILIKSSLPGEAPAPDMEKLLAVARKYNTLPG